MSYTLTLLKTAADCDAVLQFAGSEKADLEFKKVVMTHSLQDFSQDSLELDAELTSVNSEVQTLQTMIASLPEGKVKEENKDKLKTAEYKQHLLNKRRNKKGFQAQLERELDLAHADTSIANLTAFISDVTAKKATL
jgi:hypothetical protein